MDHNHPQTPSRRQPSTDSNSSPGGRSNSSLSSSPGSHVFRMLGKLSKAKKGDSLKSTSSQRRESIKLSKEAAMSSAKEVAASAGVRKNSQYSLKRRDDDANSAFLRNLHMDSSSVKQEAGISGSFHAKTPTRDNTSYSDADSAFLRAVRGESSGASATPSVSGRIERKTSFEDDNPTSVAASASAINKVEAKYTDADSAFLRAFRGEQDPPPNTPSKEEKKPSQPPSLTEVLPPVDETNALPQDEMAHANAAFLGALHASSDQDDSTPNKPGGTFVFESKKKHSSGSSMAGSATSSQSDANSMFLMAMRASSSNVDSFGGTGDWNLQQQQQHQQQGEWNSGTLILNQPQDFNSGTLILNQPKTDKQDQSRSFLMSIQAGQTSDHEVSNEVKVDEASDTEDDEEEVDNLVVPNHPYVEKVMMPRPLFFGHDLPPRILEEAEAAVKMYKDEEKRGWFDGKDDNEGAGFNKASSVMDSAVKESATEESSFVSKSTTSTAFSTTVGGGRLFESSLAPCARNFEGALETFGFGRNPFHSNGASEDKESELQSQSPLKEPHPYVSIYSPVWGDRARTDRARSYRKKAKLAEAAVEEATGGMIVNKDASNQSFESANQSSWGSDDGSVEYKDNGDSVKTPTATDKANNQFLSQLRSSSPDIVADGNDFSRDQFSMFARAGSPTVETPSSSKGNAETANDFSTDQFLMFARGDDAGGTFIGSPIMEMKKGGTFKGGTFVTNVKPVCTAGDGDSDGDSIAAAEERKAVGLNDNMAAAAAMLSGKEVDIDADEIADGIGTPMCNMAAGGGARAANKFGRAYSNLELTGGCVPRFSCDDPSLPHESDLGVFETKEDEKRTTEYRREKNIIEDMTVPGIMPLVVCPSQCTDADDSQSWNSRAAASEGGSTRKGNNTVLISLDGNRNNTSTDTGASPANTRSQTYEASRVGWWNLPDGFEEMSSASAKSRQSKKRKQSSGPLVDVFPATDDPIPLDVITNLWPSPQVLRDNNITPAELHSATSLARFMPHLSDRSPNLRHLQIDTTAVGFPKLGGEVEPMFCRLAIYHFEMNPIGSSNDTEFGDSVSSAMSASSANSHPNKDRCGPVTEALNFDVVQDPEVIKKCKKALWPYANESDLEKLPGGISSEKVSDDVILEGSSCGVFPLPSHLNISNLYAVLLVHKVVSDNILDPHHPYFKPSRRDKSSASNQKEDIDLTKLRENASKSADSYGQLITPIAFGVLPLMQIVGNEESPKVPVTRVVQIPLFKFEQGRGTDVILDHILGMLHPRAVPPVGKIASLTRGHAFLVMRYYGFLGLHSILSKMKIAHKRLVDSSRELQVKRQGDAKYKSLDRRPDIDDPYIVPPWRQQYVVEPAPFGGRIISNKLQASDGTPSGSDSENSAGEGYAQELSSLPLEKSGVEFRSSSRRSGRSTGSNKFDSNILHTSFQNELICHPRVLKRCSKKNIVIKVELRELQWNDSLKVYAAIPMKPSIHNPRRGPWLVDEAFTSCALKSANPQFLDEFKIKLPLILGDSAGTVGLFFSVYKVNIQKKRQRLIQAISRQSSQYGTDMDSALEQIGCGVLPLSSDDSPSCLLSNGDHNVQINYRVLDLSDSTDRIRLMLPTKKQHRSKNSTSSLGSSVVRHLKSLSWTNEDVVRSFSIDTLSTDEEESLNAKQELVFESLSYPAGTVFLERMDSLNNQELPESSDHRSVKSDTGLISGHKSIKSDIEFNQVKVISDETGMGMRQSLSSGDLQQLGSNSPESSKVSIPEPPIKEDLVLKVNIIAFSAVHPQNKILSDLFMMKPDRPRCVTTEDFSGLSPWGKHRSEILYRLKPERIPPFNFVGGALAETERKLLEPVVSLSKTSKCPAYDVIPHLLRVISQLLRTMTSGIGEPSILWASPDSLIPLRLNAFASLLHVVSSASHYMAKTGLRLLDGDTKWNISALSKTLALIYDEFEMFGGPLEDIVQKAGATPTKKSPPRDTKGSPKLLNKKPPKLSRSKTTNQIGSNPKPRIIERFSSEELNPLSFDIDAMLKSSTPHASVEVDEAPVPTSSRDIGIKVDSRNDFMSAMREAAANEADNNDSGGNGRLSSHLMSSISAMSGATTSSNRRRFFTLPAMATIEESDTEENRVGGLDSNLSPNSQNPLEKKVAADAHLDTELIVHGDRAKPKQFRVPQVDKVGHVGSTDGISSFLDSLSLPPAPAPAPPPQPKTNEKETTDSALSTSQTALDDDVIENAGTAFLDQISDTIEGMGMLSTVKPKGGEERRVGAAHHRKTRSRCSIDWTLPPTDMLLEKDQQIEQLNRTKATIATSNPVVGFSPILTSFTDDASSGDDYETDDGSAVSKQEDSSDSQKVHPLKKTPKDRKNKAGSMGTEPCVLPDFADRMSGMKDDGKPLRWWPYVYEVIIYQWLTLLIEQTKKGDSANKTYLASDYSKSTLSPIVTKYLSHAAKAARGATIRCAPYLLEIIKQSLSWRIDVVFRNRKAKKKTTAENESEKTVPQPVKLDGNIMAALEKLITLLTDASIDSRNFDSFEFRKISIDVNDAVVIFIRDLFAMLDVQSVHRLVMVYFSRFVTKEGKHWHDRDSKTTGLRCSWETTKLRLNAITLFIRFSDFMKVSVPLMEIENWETRTNGKSIGSTRRFYTNVLEKITRLGISELTSSEGPISKVTVAIPPLRPHWLAELCTDICLGATGHAEESIQQRASSLLFELFWTISQEGRARGNISIVASVFVPFIPKVLAHVEYFSTLAGKSQLRKDIIPCVLFVLQSAPVGIMRALWRKLAKQAEGKAQQNDSASKYGGIIGTQFEAESMFTDNSLGDNDGMDEDTPPDVYDMFGLLNLSLSTIEYDGCDVQSEENPVWRKEFLLSADSNREQLVTAMDPRMFSLKNGSGNGCSVEDNAENVTTHNTRRWHAHDCAMIIIHSCRQIVRETLGMLKPSTRNEADFSESDPNSLDFQHGSLSYDELLLLSKTNSNSIDNVDSIHVLGALDGDKRNARKARRLKMETLAFGVSDTVIFVRAATSVYLHALTMRQSDVVVVKTFTAAVEIVKIFGIKVFLNAVGETLQHWIRVTLEHCGARRSEVRVDASEFLNLLLRLTWDSYGSFFRIRLPLLAVQTEVMERLVAKATAKYEKEQRALRLQPVKFTTDSAEAALTPLWRTIDRIHFQSASLNLSFKSALARLAIMMKKIFKAYLAVHALNALNQTGESSDAVKSESNPFIQRMRVSVHRIVSNAAGYSRQLVGNQAVTHLDLTSIQSETVEDSLFNAADVFSSSELPSHRFAFLEKLAEFHRMRSRFAEEATCRLHIYQTYREASKQHAHIWSSSPFLPWASNQLEQSGIDDPTGEGVNDIDFENLSVTSGKYLECNPSFRKIFYRAADSVMVRTGDWGGFGGKFLFYGVTLKSEFNSTTPWFTLRQMEDTMADEAELAGDLFLKAGIVESSRHAWNVATCIYSETFNYARLARAYGKLALVVTSKIPVVDTSNQFDMSSQIGRFYKVYFHGGAPDDLLHAQGTEGFVYIVPSSFSIKDFASRLESSIRSILPAKLAIDILLDDGSPVVPKNTGGKRSALSGATGEPIKIKITPLRPLFKVEDAEKCFRGTPEWFQMKTDEYDNMIEADATGGILMHQRQISSSSAAGNTLSSSGSMSMSVRRTSLLSSNFRTKRHQQSFSNDGDRDGTISDTIGVDRFYFTQPAKRDPVRGFRDWLKVPTGSFAERSLRVTELQVEGNFPACVTRQKIIHRAIFTQSPLEAGVEAVSTWCSLLFRTIMATNGLRVLSNAGRHEEGLNIICVAKVLADCIHSSGVKQIGLSFLSVNPQTEQTNNDSGYYSSYERLSEEEIEKVQTKLARIIVTFLELLHLLIARNRHVILAAVQARKRRNADNVSTTSGSYEQGFGTGSRAGCHTSPLKYEEGQDSDSMSITQLKLGGDMLGKSITTSKTPSHKASGSDRTDAAIGIQSELQRGFISLVRALSPNLLDTINTEVPRWMRQCCQENYFSSGLYRQADIPIGDELFFNTDNDERGMKDDSSVPVSINRGSGHVYQRSGSSPGNSLCDTEISDGKRSETRSRHTREITLGSSYSSSFGYENRGRI